jgi:hypothetical protein
MRQVGEIDSSETYFLIAYLPILKVKLIHESFYVLLINEFAKYLYKKKV